MMHSLCISNIKATVIAVLVTMSLSAAQAAALATETPRVDDTADFRGVVTDQSNAPLARVKVRLIDKTTGASQTTSTGRDGRFDISSLSVHPLLLVIDPGLKSGLASAVFDNIPARQDRQLIVHLPRGFNVTGRAEYGGTALKGLMVSVAADNPQNSREKTYGGGSTVTGAGGRFKLVLTPGRKRLLLTNPIYANIPRQIVGTITVSGDTNLGSLDLAPRQGAGTPQ